VNEILSFKDNQYVTGIKSKGEYIAIGSSKGDISIMDGSCEVIKFKGDDVRVSSFDWNDSILTFGTKSGRIGHFDLKSGKVVGKNEVHKGEICGLKWNADKKLLASGSNDNTVRIWQMGSNIARSNIQAHKSAVKALAWCPWRNGILSTGGGSKDKSIKTWDVHDNKLLSTVVVDSQVCTLNYVEKYKEIISSHGFSENNICIWKASTMKKIDTFGKHDARVLHVAVNHNGSSIVSVSGDENLKFWKIYDEVEQVERQNDFIFR